MDCLFKTVQDIISMFFLIISCRIVIVLKFNSQRIIPDWTILTPVWEYEISSDRFLYLLIVLCRFNKFPRYFTTNPVRYHVMSMEWPWAYTSDFQTGRRETLPGHRDRTWIVLHIFRFSTRIWNGNTAYSRNSGPRYDHVRRPSTLYRASTVGFSFYWDYN